MNKGIAEEVVGIIIIIAAILILAIFLVSRVGFRGAEVSRTVYGRSLDEAANLALMSLLHNKAEIINKTYIEIIIDAVFQGENKTRVFYGHGVGTIHSKDLVDPLFDKYFGKGRWKLRVDTTQGSVDFGELKLSRRTYVYTVSVPTPPKMKAKVRLYVG